jgi:hypothetical protein
MGMKFERKTVSASIKGRNLYLGMPTDGQLTVRMFTANGRNVMDRKILAKGTALVSLNDMTAGVYLLECAGIAQKLVKTVVVGK